MLNLCRKSLQSFIWLFLLGLPVFQLQAFAQPVSLPSSVEISPDSSKSICPANLGTTIEAIINRPQLARSRIGIYIQTLESDSILYERDAQYYFIPASNIKLFTTAAALRQLGSQFRIRTSVYGSGTIPNLSSLRIVGRGDPSLTTTGLKYLAYQLKQQGVQQVSALIVDDDYFRGEKINSSWEWSDVYSYYATSVNSLILNENAVVLKLFPQQIGQPLKLNWSDSIAASQWQVKNQAIAAAKGATYSVKVEGNLGEPLLKISGELAIDSQPDTWGLAVINPEKYFLESFRQILIDTGIGVEQVLVSTKSLDVQVEKELAALESPPLEALLRTTNQESNNLFAEALLKILASELNTDRGTDAVKRILTELGVDPESYILADGSGLSRHNLATPKAIVQILKLMDKTPDAEIYRNSLAVAGVNGTLKRRFLNTSVQSNLQGKTGTLSGIASLAGYLEVPNYQPLVFSIIIERSGQPSSTLRQTIDEIVLLLGKLREC